jgi:hypothetical protein
MVHLGATSYGDLYFRTLNRENYWRLRASVALGNYRLQYRMGGVTTTLVTVAQAPVDGDIVRVVAYGNSITCWVNGVVIINAYGSAVMNTQTFVGLGGQSNGVERNLLDNFSMGDFEDGCTATATQTATETATLSNTWTASETSTETETKTNTATRTETATATNTATRTETQTISETKTQTATGTKTATHTDTRTATETRTGTATRTATNTATVTKTTVPSNTATDTETATNTSTQTNTATQTQTASETVTPTDTATATPTEIPNQQAADEKFDCVVITTAMNGRVTVTLPATWTVYAVVGITQKYTNIPSQQCKNYIWHQKANPLNEFIIYAFDDNWQPWTSSNITLCFIVKKLSWQ